MKNIFVLLFVMVSLGLSAQSSYRIYPVPQQQENGLGEARFSRQVCIVAEPGIDRATIERAKQIVREHGLQVATSSDVYSGQSNIVLGINGSRGVADKMVRRQGLKRDVFGKPKYDRHILSLTADRQGTAQVLILGEHTDAAFCALASLEQMMDQKREVMPCVTLYDYADIQNRGVIEGYYGVPYSAEVTKDLFRFMARYKLNTYMYGAKSDPYHSRFWADPYPTSITPEERRIGYLSQEMLSDITRVAHETKVNFIWAIHPGTAFVDSRQPEVIDRILLKFEDMYRLGVRQFGVFVDDVGVPSDDETLKLGADRLTELQRRIDGRWNRPEAAPSDKVKPLHYVPQLYAYSWTSTQQAERFFKALSHTPEKVSIYITGANVWSVPNNDDLQFIRKPLGRDAAWWWNYPCNDNDMTKLFPMDMYANFHDETHISNFARLDADMTGTNTLIINPMQQGEVSKIALFSMADYAWNQERFDNNRSWRASLKAVVGEDRAKALRTLAPFLRYYDGDALRSMVENYKVSVAGGNPRPWGIINTLSNVLRACQDLRQMETSANESDRLFFDDVRPWLLKLEAMSQETIHRLKGEPAETIDYEGDSRFQFPILTGLGEGISLGVRTAEPSGQVLRPFIDWLRENEK